MGTLTYSGTLQIVSCWCGLTHAIPIELHREQQRNASKAAYCPVGHTYVRGGPSKAEKDLAETRDLLERRERQLATERARLDQAKAEAKTERRRAAAARGQATKARNRAAKGVCPAPGCKRSFVNVAKHVATCHPDIEVS